ncbi:hypothetical protein [Morganella psychrotolerans]
MLLNICIIKKLKCICINDSAVVDQFENMKNAINNELHNLFPKKSSFEI